MLVKSWFAFTSNQEGLAISEQRLESLEITKNINNNKAQMKKQSLLSIIKQIFTHADLFLSQQGKA